MITLFFLKTALLPHVAEEAVHSMGKSRSLCDLALTIFFRERQMSENSVYGAGDPAGSRR